MLTERPGMERVLPANIFPPASGLTSPLGNPRDYHRKGKLFSLVSIAEQSTGRSYVIQLAQDRSEDEEFKKNFGILLAVVLATGVVASAVIAITVTRRGLRPLGEMPRSLERIRPT